MEWVLQSIVASLAIPAVDTLERLRYRSGTYPESVPSGCDLRLHVPSLFSSHPLQRSGSVEAHLGPVFLASLAVPRGASGSLQNPYLYVADHRRYSRGGSLWAWHWLAEQSGAQGHIWMKRLLNLVAMVEGAIDGFITWGLPTWAHDPSEWLDLLQSGWQHGVLATLGILAELSCHRYNFELHEDLQPMTRACMERPIGDFGRCEPSKAMAMVGQVINGSAQIRDSHAISDLLATCCQHCVAEPAAVLGWIQVWHHLQVLVSNRTNSAACSVEASFYSQSSVAKQLCGELCQPHVSRSVGAGEAVVHVLSASLASQGSGQEGL